MYTFAETKTKDIMKIRSRTYRAKSLTTKKYVYGALTITTGYYEGYAIIHTTDVISQKGEEDVGGWEFIHSNIVVDVDTLQEKLNGKWINLAIKNI